jgi:hypothetical protein|tara:strand:+ start:1194 stop:2129 length:936 start_codon:yes stop_codon:yes gene_type:complete
MAQEEYNPKREQLKEKSPGPRSILDRAKNTVSNPPNNPNNPGNPNLNFSRLVTTSTGDSISKDRSRQVKRDDTVKDVAVGLYDADEAIHYYFENVIQPRVTEGQKEIRVPIIYGSPERWKSVQKSGVFRDKTGKIQFPILMYRRTGIERQEGFNKLDANHPHLYYTVGKKYNQRNRYDKFDLLIGRKPSQESYNIVIPDYVKLTYECILVTEFIGHQNKILEDVNYASNSYWGKDNYYKFLANMTSFDVSNDLEQGSDRGIRATFALEMNGYIIPDNLQKDMTQYNKRDHTVSKILMGTKIVSDINNLPNK